MIDVTQPLQVSECLNAVNELFEAALPAVMVEGEVASFKVNQNKFVFFDIKDENASLGCFMMAFALKFPLEDGMKVRILAQPKLTQWGKFSLTVREVQPVGEGALKKSFELLKAKLEKEGLFDIERKRSLPKIPKRIGVVSSIQAAGYKDFIKILENRWGGLEIIVADSVVQGLEAPAKIIESLDKLNQLSEPLDVVAIIRGGGSADDLSAFNSEDLVRAVAASRTPTIAGIGHEVDESLCDLAADKRASTPSNAAEILVPDKITVLRQVDHQTKAINSLVLENIEDNLLQKNELASDIKLSVERFLQTKTEKLNFMKRTLAQLNPELILRRGYSLVSKNDRLVSKKSDVTIGDEVAIKFSDGSITAEVKNV